MDDISARTDEEMAVLLVRQKEKTIILQEKDKMMIRISVRVRVGVVLS
jgi:hypothetical protein